jgi:hypothetical protein
MVDHVLLANRKDQTMNRLNVRSWYGFAGGILAAVAVIGVMAAMGAGTAASNPAARYSTQSFLVLTSMFLTVTDNQTNKLYIYSTEPTGKDPDFNLRMAIDLSQAGNPVIKYEAPEKPAERPAKKPTR